MKQKIIAVKDAEKIEKGLNTIYSEIKEGKFKFRHDLEDIHMNVENRLRELIGDVAGKLHTARSRNDQVVTDFKLWIRDHIMKICRLLDELIESFLVIATKHADTVMPGYTHLQAAQPVTFGHHMMAYVEMLGRDVTRFMDCARRLNECPLGVAALAGTSFNVDRDITARLLGFREPTRNSLDTVADRDYALEFLSTASIMAMHLSRFAEELVIWCSQPFSFVSMSDAFSTGSSIMPQKRNPDAAELLRAKVGGIAGSFQGLLMVLKGLPLTYAKDLQDDKKTVFDAYDTCELCLRVTKGVVDDLIVNEKRLLEATQQGFLEATDLADWLVQNLDVPFRKAHHITGTLVKMAEDRDIPLAELTLQDMQSVEPKINNDIYSVLDVESCVLARTSFGGTAPFNVHKQIDFWNELLNKRQTPDE